MFNLYFQDIFNTTKTGDATEESYYPCIKRLLEKFGEEEEKELNVIPLPKRTEAGNPDFRIWDRIYSPHNYRKMHRRTSHRR